MRIKSTNNTNGSRIEKASLPARRGQGGSIGRDTCHAMARITATCLVSVAAGTVAAQEADVPALQDLLKAEVTSVARKAQSLADTPAALFVSTHGTRSLPRSA